MNQKETLKRLPKEIINNLDDLSEEYLLYLINRMEILRFRPWNSQIQYLVTNTHRIHLEQALLTYDTLNTLNINTEGVLNVGTGGGYFEYVCKYFNTPVDTVEFINPHGITDGVKAFVPMRNYFGIDITYTMSDVQKDNFTIHKCTKKYDYLILFRFLFHATAEENKIVDYNNAYKILQKLSKYSENCIIIGRKEWDSFHEFTSFDKKINGHLIGNINNILTELKTKII